MAAGEGGVGNRILGQVYRCFLVRCWLEEGAGPDREPAGTPAWRFTVQQAGPDAIRRSFARFHDMVAQIESELASCAGSVQDEPKKDSPLQFQDISEVRAGGTDEQH